MRSMKLGGVDLVRIGLGTNRLTRTPDNVALVKAAVAAGVQMIDSAHLYTGGESEETIGAALSPVPSGCIVATKGGFGGPGHGRPDVLRAEIEESFRRLAADTITLYYLHRVDPETPLEESLTAISEYRDRGKILNVGVSDVSIEQIERSRKVVPIVAVQNQYNLADRKYDEVIDYCEREGIAFVAFYPLRGDGGKELDQIAKSHQATPQQIKLAWLLRRSPVMLPIPGTLSLRHLKENLSALEIELSDAEFDTLRLDEA
jgi:pyridoxine 4-dehydrogenase